MATTCVLPFWHPVEHISLCSGISTSTACRFNKENDTSRFALGYVSGLIAIYTYSSKHTDLPRLELLAYLHGHKSPIVSLTTYETTSDIGQNAEYLVSISQDGQICKWSSDDGKCLQTVDCVLDARPRGVSVIKLRQGSDKASQAPWLSDTYLLVYGCTTSMIILSATTLETVALWTSNLDWPFPINIDHEHADAYIYTFSQSGQAQGWLLSKNPSEALIEIVRDHDVASSTYQPFGNVTGVYKVRDTGNDTNLPRLMLLHKVGVEAWNIADEGQKNQKPFIVAKSGFSNIRRSGLCDKLVWIWHNENDFALLSCDLNSNKSTTVPLRNGERIVHANVMQNESLQSILCFCEHEGDEASTDILYVGNVDSKQKDITWERYAGSSIVSIPPPRYQGVLKTISTSCDERLFIAIDNSVHTYSLSGFLLHPESPLKVIDLVNARAPICLLNAVHIGSFSKTLILVGTRSGSLYAIDPVSTRISNGLSIHSSPIEQVVCLPSDLAPRLRDTLFVTTRDGCSAVIDIVPTGSSVSPKLRTLLRFPSAKLADIVSISTQKSSNLLLILDKTGHRKLWDVDAKDGCGVLKGDSNYRHHDHQKTGSNSNGATQTLSDLSDLDDSQDLWREKWLGYSEEDGIRDLESFGACRITKSPTIMVDLIVICGSLQALKEDSLKIVTNSHAAIVNAQAVLRAVLANANVDLCQSAIYKLQEESYLPKEFSDKAQQYSDNLRAILPLEKDTAACLGLLGARNHIALFNDITKKREKDQHIIFISSRVKALISLVVVAIVHGLLEALDKKLPKDEVQFILWCIGNHIIYNCRVDSTSSQPDLGFYAKYWSDPEGIHDFLPLFTAYLTKPEYVRNSARTCLHQQIIQLSPDEILETATFWQAYCKSWIVGCIEYLKLIFEVPIRVAPELYGAKEIIRSVIVLAEIVMRNKDMQTLDKLRNLGLQKNVALSLELFLLDPIQEHQDIAAELIGAGWLLWQNHFDSFEVIHILVKILGATTSMPRRRALLNSFISIAEKNSPLLVSGLGNCISHFILTEKLNSPTFAENMSLSISAMKTIIYIVKENPVYFAEVELQKVIVDAVIKVVEPQAGVLREKLLSDVSLVVNELVNAYPTIAFHRPTQKLGLSTLHRGVTVYDLRSATPPMVLEGPTRPLNYLTFSQDGKYLVAVDLTESLLYVWRIVGNFLTSFMGAGLSKLSESSTNVIAKAKHSINRGSGKGQMRVEFTGDRIVTITTGKEKTTINV